MATYTEQLLTAQEAADYIGVSINAIYQWRWTGCGPGIVQAQRPDSTSSQ